MEQEENKISTNAEDALRAFLKELVVDPLSKEQGNFLRKLNSEISASIENNESLLDVKKELDELYKELENLKQNVIERTDKTQSLVINNNNNLSQLSNDLGDYKININNCNSIIEKVHNQVESINSKIASISNSTQKSLKIIQYIQISILVVFFIYIILF